MARALLLRVLDAFGNTTQEIDLSGVKTPSSPYRLLEWNPTAAVPKAQTREGRWHTSVGDTSLPNIAEQLRVLVKGSTLDAVNDNVRTLTETIALAQSRNQHSQAQKVVIVHEDTTSGYYREAVLVDGNVEWDPNGPDWMTYYVVDGGEYATEVALQLIHELPTDSETTPSTSVVLKLPKELGTSRTEWNFYASGNAAVTASEVYGSSIPSGMSTLYQHAMKLEMTGQAATSDKVYIQYQTHDIPYNASGNAYWQGKTFTFKVKVYGSFATESTIAKAIVTGKDSSGTTVVGPVSASTTSDGYTELTVTGTISAATTRYFVLQVELGLQTVTSGTKTIYITDPIFTISGFSGYAELKNNGWGGNAVFLTAEGVPSPTTLRLDDIGSWGGQYLAPYIWVGKTSDREDLEHYPLCKEFYPEAPYTEASYTTSNNANATFGTEYQFTVTQTGTEYAIARAKFTQDEASALTGPTRLLVSGKFYSGTYRLKICAGPPGTAILTIGPVYVVDPDPGDPTDEFTEMLDFGTVFLPPSRGQSGLAAGFTVWLYAKMDQSTTFYLDALHLLPADELRLYKNASVNDFPLVDDAGTGQTYVETYWSSAGQYGFFTAQGEQIRVGPKQTLIAVVCAGPSTTGAVGGTYKSVGKERLKAQITYKPARESL